MKFEITIEFPGKDWAAITDVVEYHDKNKAQRGETERTALSQVETKVKQLKRRYAKYGAEVSWRTHGESAQC